MATNMAELLALLRGPNRASLSSTPPPGKEPTADPTPWVPPTQATENMDAPAPPTLHMSMAHPFTSPFPPAPTAVPLPPTAFFTSDQVLSAPPPVSMLVPAAIYAAPPPTVFPASSAPAPTHPQVAELPSYPPLQPHTSFPYQAPPPINTTFPKPGTPTHFKIPEFKTYEGTTDPRHHLRHYRGKMLQYWEYEEFVIHSFQDSPSRSALDWLMSLRAEDIPTWEDLSQKFTDQYRYCAEAPPTLLELSTKEMAGKKLDLGIKLGRMENPASKGEESPKKVPATSSSSGGRRGKEVSVNAVNMAHQAPQQYSVNFTFAPPVAPSYAPHAPQYRLNPLLNRSTILHYRLHPHLRCRRPSSTIMPLLHPRPLNTNPQLRGLLSRHNESHSRKVNRAEQYNRDPADNTRPYRSRFPTFTGKLVTRSGQRRPARVSIQPSKIRASNASTIEGHPRQLLEVKGEDPGDD
ncbi:hypothetical protein CRG98_006822 [Punica granatum]|uniref:Retrotransposon gag domain-containing protein n=1 Tax=Punica granatum TaxID=22663 RepID=A0A2I0KWQ8_PUNGR|nr:hypothetical protein CRG98_006822 [Punica granatum]